MRLDSSVNEIAQIQIIVEPNSKNINTLTGRTNMSLLNVSSNDDAHFKVFNEVDDINGNNQLIGKINNERLVNDSSYDSKKLIGSCSGLDSSDDIVSTDDNIQQQLQQQTNEIHQLIYERDASRNETEILKEVLSCVMEAVQILTSQMKNTHFELLNDSTSPTASHLSHSVSEVRSMLSDLSGDFSRRRTEIINGVTGEEENIENDGHQNHSDNRGSVDSFNSESNSVSFQLEVTSNKNNRYVEQTHQQNFSCQNKFRSRISLSSSVATYMSEENKRFSELLELTSSSSPNHHHHHIGLPSDHELLPRIRSGLIGLGHSCQMVSENANMLHDEALTFLIDLQNANTKLHELQHKCKKTEKVAKKLYRENKMLKAELEKSKTQKKVLVKELKALMAKKALRKEYETHLLKAWDIHERIINLPKKISLNHSSSSSLSSSGESIMANNDDGRPETPFSYVSKSTGITPPSSMDFEELIQSCPTTESYYCGAMTSSGERTEVEARSKPLWVSSMPVLQLTPTPSTVDIADTNTKATLCSKDLHQFNDDDNTYPNIDNGHNAKLDTRPITHKKKKIEKSLSSLSNSSNPALKSENTFKTLFYNSKKSSDKFKDTTIKNTASEQSNTAKRSKKPKITMKISSAAAVAPVTTASSSSFSKSPTVNLSSPSFETPSVTSSTKKNKLPEPMKVIKRKKKTYKQYKIVGN